MTMKGLIHNLNIISPPQEDKDPTELTGLITRKRHQPPSNKRQPPVCDGVIRQKSKIWEQPYFKSWPKELFKTKVLRLWTSEKAWKLPHDDVPQNIKNKTTHKTMT